MYTIIQKYTTSMGRLELIGFHGLVLSRVLMAAVTVYIHQKPNVGSILTRVLLYLSKAAVDLFLQYLFSIVARSSYFERI